jgi:hypothetical protein
MIIKRIATGLTKQNWSSLVLEILVVIVGIFFGLQADSWYESKSKKKELDSYFGALADELANSAWMRTNYVRWHERVIDGLKEVLAVLDGAPLKEDEEELLYFALTNVGSPPTSPQRFAVLNAMQAAGMLQLIESPDLRQLLGEILSGLEPEYREYERYVSALDAPPFSADIVGYALDSDDEVVVTSVNWELARAEPAFRQRVLQGIGMYSSLLRSHRYRIAMDEDVLKILSDSGFQSSGNWLEETQKRLSN